MEIYVIKLDEVLWGSLLVAITMAIHGTGMFGVSLTGEQSFRACIKRSCDRAG